MTQNLAAFLSMIAASEGTDKASDPYRVCFGYLHTIADLSDHPALTGEWSGERLPDQLCINAGFSPGCVSTAAGKYQITKRTWAHLKALLHLPDFTAPSQNQACVQLIKERKAFDLVNAGQVADAIALCRNEWASLPGNTANQPQKTMAELIQAYGAAGGAFA